MIEIIATTIEDAIKIEAFGGDRIELVSALSEGGLTPSYSLIKEVASRVKIPVNVMIRPHANSFAYTKEEIELMKQDIIIAKNLKVNGVVFGVLNSKNEICEKSLNELLSVCDGIDVTFHKAIDELENPVEGIKILGKYPQINTVLTSGGKGPILDNIHVIKNMMENAQHINIMIGGGLSFENIDYMIENGKGYEYHFGTAIRQDKSPFKSIDPEKMKKLVSIIKKCSMKI